MRQAGSGKPPLCYFDVAELIQRIPDTLPSKEMEATLFLFALHTGARALTCEAVNVGDIQQLEVCSETGLACAVVILRVTKGNPNWNHPVVLEGYLNQNHPLDVIYHLNQYLIQSCDMSLAMIAESTGTEREWLNRQPLFPLKRDA